MLLPRNTRALGMAVLRPQRDRVQELEGALNASLMEAESETRKRMLASTGNGARLGLGLCFLTLTSVYFFIENRNLGII